MKNYFYILFLLFFSCKKTETLQQKDNTADNYYKKAKKTNQDSAFYYFNLAKNSYLESADSSGIGKSLVNMAIIQHDNGDYYGSIETSLEANKFLKNTRDSLVKLSLAANYNNMGICSSFLYNFDNSVKFYKEAIKQANSPENKFTYYNNLGNVLTTLKRYKEAKENLEKALNTKDKINYARALNNYARAKYNEDSTYNALPELYEALKIRQRENDSYGENSSYATISNYFFKKDRKVSLDYAKKMLSVSTKNNSKEDQLQALQKIISLDKKNYLDYFEKFKILNDSLQISKSRAKNQFAVIRYDVEQKNTENKTLKLGKLESENSILRLYIGTIVLIAIIIIIIFWYRRRQLKLKQEKELEVKNTQLKMSKRVHDVVANGIYQVMAKIENQEDFDRDKTLDELEFVYEKSRDISYEKAGEEKEFSQEISGLIASFNNVEVKTFTAGNTAEIWQTVSPEVKEEVYQMIRELMVNMKKHSRASHVALRFEKTGDTIDIQYKDNGVGISGDLIYKNGLRNTASRMEAIGGTITFDTKIEKGLKVNLSFPAS